MNLSGSKTCACASLQHDGPQSLEEVAALVQAALIRKAPLLAECFGTDISPDGAIKTLPQLIEVRDIGSKLLPQHSQPSIQLRGALTPAVGNTSPSVTKVGFQV